MIDTTTVTVTEYGAYGPYVLGYEYTTPADGSPVRAVLRPCERRRFLGYAYSDGGVTTSVIAITQDGLLTAWRTGPAGGQLHPCESPLSPPYMHLPDEEWGPDLALQSPGVRYEHNGIAIEETVARARIEAWIETQPQWQRRIWRRDMERSWTGAAP